jgi:hypothetical protein
MPIPRDEAVRDYAEWLVRRDACRRVDDRWRPSHSTPPEVIRAVADARERLVDEVEAIQAEIVEKARRWADRIEKTNAELPADEQWPLPSWVRHTLNAA